MRSLHWPPFRQGWDRHSSISAGIWAGERQGERHEHQAGGRGPQWALSVDTGRGGLEDMSWGHQAMVVTTAHWDGAPGLSCSLALLTIALRGVTPDAWQAADTGVVVLTEGVAQLTLVFSQ